MTTRGGTPEPPQIHGRGSSRPPAQGPAGPGLPRGPGGALSPGVRAPRGGWTALPEQPPPGGRRQRPCGAATAADSPLRPSLGLHPQTHPQAWEAGGRRLPQFLGPGAEALRREGRGGIHVGGPPGTPAGSSSRNRRGQAAAGPPVSRLPAGGRGACHYDRVHCSHGQARGTFAAAPGGRNAFPVKGHRAGAHCLLMSICPSEGLPPAAQIHLAEPILAVAGEALRIGAATIDPDFIRSLISLARPVQAGVATRCRGFRRGFWAFAHRRGGRCDDPGWRPSTVRVRWKALEPPPASPLPRRSLAPERDDARTGRGPSLCSTRETGRHGQFRH